MKKISIIVPCYNEEQAIPYFYKEITKVAESMKTDFEFIFVNDGSKDKTWELIKDYIEFGILWIRIILCFVNKPFYRSKRVTIIHR